MTWLGSYVIQRLAEAQLKVGSSSAIMPRMAAFLDQTSIKALGAKREYNSSMTKTSIHNYPV